eukprot:jgi/Psemu1/259103/estExt_Genewise1Plus.C_3320025
MDTPAPAPAVPYLGTVVDAPVIEEKDEDHDWPLSNHKNDAKPKYGDNARDVVGYGANPVQPHWPKSAKVALNFVINYEEGSEMCLLHGDKASECLLSDNGPNTKPSGQRNLNVESMYDYGSRCGFWRLHRLFTNRKIPVTVWACGMALERNMEVVGAIKQQEEWEVSSHGYRWWDYQNVDEDVEKEHIERTIEIHKNLFGKRPVGLYQGKPSANTRRLVIEEGGFLYDSDAYNDDLPYWTFEHCDDGEPHLVIPYTLVENDMLFTAPNGWSQPDDFLRHLKRTLDYLVMEGRAGQPKMMTVGLHCRLSRPGRVAALAEFVDYAKSYGKEVWITTRESIANHWYENHLPRGCGNPILAARERRKKSSPKSSRSHSKRTIDSTQRFSYLGNIAASRNSEEYRKSLQIGKSNSSDSKGKVGDVI